MSLLYLNLCYNEVCYKGTAMYFMSLEANISHKCHYVLADPLNRFCFTHISLVSCVLLFFFFKSLVGLEKCLNLSFSLRLNHFEGDQDAYNI